jgi:hypothetical protein
VQAGTRCIAAALYGSDETPEEQVMNEARRPVETPIVETPVEARAGFLDRPVLVVLCVSLALGIVVLGALWFGFFAPSA